VVKELMNPNQRKIIALKQQIINLKKQLRLKKVNVHTLGGSRPPAYPVVLKQALAYANDRRFTVGTSFTYTGSDLILRYWKVVSHPTYGLINIIEVL
jgi:hypothetical protein